LERIAARTEKIVQANSKTLEKSREDTDELVIASISLDIDETTDLDRYDEPVHGTDYILRNLKPGVFDRVVATVPTYIEAAREQGAQFVCINELGFPTCSPETDGFHLFQQRSNEFLERLVELSEKHGLYIIGGTYHCTKTFYNKAVLCHPGKLIKKNPLTHAKKTSAHSVGEVVRIPYDRSIRVYITRHCSVGILVCLDSFDQSLITGLVRARASKGSYHYSPDIVFVPSLNPAGSYAHQACEDLSNILANVVVLTNTQKYGGAHWKTVYVCGKPIEQKCVENVQGTDGTTRLFRINVNEYRTRSELLKINRTSLFYRTYGVRDFYREGW